MRKRNVILTVEDIERPIDDPREYYAVRNNLLRAQREIEYAEARLAEAERQAAQELSAVRQSYEMSRSWKLTQPLRDLRRVARAHRPARRRPACGFAARSLFDR